MPPTPTDKGSSRNAAAHPYQRPAPSAPAHVSPSTSKASKKSKKKAKREKKESIVCQPTANSVTSLAGPSPDKKRTKKKRKSHSREMQPSDAPLAAVVPVPPKPAANAASCRDAGPSSIAPIVLPKKPVLADSETNVPVSSPAQTIAGDRPQKSSIDREVARMREEAKQREASRLELSRAHEEIEQLKIATEVAKKQQEDMQRKVEELEKAAAQGEEQKKAFDGVLQRHDATKNDLTEALSCNVCFDIYRDPYILSCGHMACKECLHQWFRSSASFRQPLVSGEISPLSDVSHRTKICHMCRCNIVRRPTRAFFLRTILEPLGLYNNTIEEGSGNQAGPSDPWHLTFPVDPQSHKLHDEADGIWRCPECLGEIADGACLGCELEFSESEGDEEDEGDWDHADGRIANIMSDMFEGVYRRVNEGLRNEGDAGDESDSSSESSHAWERPIRQSPPPRANPWLGGSDHDEHSGSEEDGYEDSFIDDDEPEALSGEDDTFLDDSFVDDESDERIPARGGPPPRVQTIASDTEDENDQPVFMGRGRRTNGRVVIADSDSSSDEEE
ncbi:hypothetical protein L198_03461 [Cryptococcus wingfieldii CBS 7118]|uniref:RING-type domain-containing protein n=1 Tax=Cryptococcus wingfieldii CBS 7118 TaxID=1295528 RepID=A0A1E3JFL7_9TREE|nr:hypothetical protein L198_03461 [Cryptococcus wingfieldii CBS 7118]ODN99617.1 hypothetical protein L198_03461 [Cryptococcus wingfieldii CBS 7118]